MNNNLTSQLTSVPKTCNTPGNGMDTNSTEKPSGYTKKNIHTQKLQPDFAPDAITSAPYRAVANTMLVATPTGHRLLQPNDVLHFEYQGTNRTWSVSTLSSETLLLKRGTSATQIMAISPLFFQVNPRCIININYLKAINTMKCEFHISADPEKDISITRNYLKILQDRIEMI